MYSPSHIPGFRKEGFLRHDWRTLDEAVHVGKAGSHLRIHGNTEWWTRGHAHADHLLPFGLEGQGEALSGRGLQVNNFLLGNSSNHFLL